ncbi:extracellular solute-binding protein [Paenibacillus sp. GCM10027626]|uniref:extracellular solute-binding protein n=1 Tax=Paenibacillus sp. GCM10027626 TaxID=3273411 RepID=UPI003643D24A
MNRKATMHILIVVLMLALVASGCTTSNKTPEGSKESKGAEGETLSFSVTLPSNGVDDMNSMVGKEWLKQMEAKMGKKLDIQFNYIPGSEYDDKVKLLITSNELPDIFMTPLFYDTTNMAEQGQILELSQYKDLMPNYMKYLNSVKDGMTRVTNADGKMYFFKETSNPRFPADRGMLVQNTSSYRYDLFKDNNIEIPKTLDEFYDAAKKLKQLYPNKYPVNTRWNDLRSLFSANHIKDDIFWDGSKYVYGVLEDGYKDALQYANKLYSEKLLDPEYTIDTDDTLLRKATNGDNFMWMADWFTLPGTNTRNSTDGKIFAISLYPSNPKYGTAWQEVANVNTPDIGWAALCISSKAKNPEELIKFIDLQYTDEMDRLITWGIEGTTYKIGEDGKPTFVDSIKNATDPWEEGDNYGMRASRKHRPGLQISSDPTAFVDFAPNDYTVFNGKYEVVPVEKSPFLLSLPMPHNEYIASWFDGPAIQFTQDESQQISEVINALKTFVKEEQAKFVAGKNSFNDWDKFIAEVKKIGDIDKVLKIYNDAAKRVLSK